MSPFLVDHLLNLDFQSGDQLATLTGKILLHHDG